MRVVALVSERPGSGKTVRAGHVAAQAEAAGVAPVVVLDGGPARRLSDWWA
ncbi:MAG: ParA family protein, partial [Proteobacteria bacterium]|nr:ParA family protein [Pseudomonadota bacterium]